MNILALSGSLRAASMNTALVATLEQLAPDGVHITRASIDLPLYNEDLPAEARAPIDRLRGEISAADALIIATPEYNYSIPGPLKNAIDWASRPGYKSPFVGKPVGIVGASNSVVGTARAQAHLKQVLLAMLAQPFPSPEILVGQASSKIADGVVSDAPTRAFLERFLKAFVAWAKDVPASTW